MKRSFFLVLILLCLPALAIAGEYQLRPDLKVVLPEVTAPWEVSTQPTPELLENMIEHALEEAEGKGQFLSRDQAKKTALQQGRNNDLYVVNNDSCAHLLISFLALDEGEKPPSAKTIANSAQYSIDGVEGKAGLLHRLANLTLQ